MRAAIVGMLAMVTLAGTAGCGASGVTSGSGASCTGPVLTVTQDRSHPVPHVTVSPGQMLVVDGYGYATCHDTNHQPASRPFSHLEVLVVQGQHRFPVGTVSAGRGGAFRISIRMPAGLRRGTAVISTSAVGETPLTVRVAALPARTIPRG